MRLLVALLLSCAVASARAERQPTVRDPWNCPPAEAFQLFLHAQTNAAEHVGHVLAMTDFSGFTNLLWHEVESGRVNPTYSVFKYRLSDNGEQSWYGEGYPVYTGSRHLYPRLSEAQLSAMLSAIRELPPTNAAPPVDQLVLVSFHQGTNWVTYNYDRRCPPKLLDRIYEVYRSYWVRNFTVQ